MGFIYEANSLQLEIIRAIAQIQRIFSNSRC